jgi:dsDNA-binding SOS-regulon protein
MFRQLKRWVRKLFLRQLRAVLTEWLEKRALQLPRSTREELAKLFGTTPETIDAVNQAIKTRVIQEFHKLWEENVQ